MDLTTLLQAPGQEPQPLTDEFGDPIVGIMPTWSPSGEQILYGKLTGSGPGALLESINVVNADGAAAHAIYTFPEPLSMGFRYPDWSPDGTRVVFGLDEVVRYTGHLFLLEGIGDPAGATLRQLTTGEVYHHDSPHWSPDGTRIAFTRSPWDEGTWGGSDIWIKDVDTGVETQVTDTPSIGEYAQGWCPYDGSIYYIEGWLPINVGRILPDGTGEEVVAPGLDLMYTVLHDFWWAPTGAWVDGINALPGESVAPRIRIADAEDLAGAQAKVRYTGCCDTLAFDSVLKGESILDWMMLEPSIGPDVATVLAFAADPATQSISGAAHLFDLNVTNSPAAQPGDMQLLTFDELLLSDDWGAPLDRAAFDGGVRTIPFASLEVSYITGPVCADAVDPVPVPVTITALDRDGFLMADCAATVNLWALDAWEWPKFSHPVTPVSATLVGGVWSGEVTVAEPSRGVEIAAQWGDILGSTNSVPAVGKGDPNGDSEVNILDVVIVANMAIGRGEWEPWQWWAGDTNRDGEVNIFDVVETANRALEEMEGMAAVSAKGPGPAADTIAVMASTTQGESQVVLSLDLSDCAGLAGIQVELKYDTKKLTYAGVEAGDLLAGTSSWTVMDNDLRGAVKAIAFTPSREVLPGGEGTVLTFTFDRTGKGRGKIDVTSVKLADASGGEIACQVAKGREKLKRK